MLTEESFHRKIARLRESVMAVLQTLLAKRHRRAPSDGGRGGDGGQWKAGADSWTKRMPQSAG